MTMSADSVPEPLGSVLSTTVGTDVVLFETESQSVAELNAAAGLIWLHIDGVSSISQIAASISPLVGRAPVDLLDDVVAAANDLASLEFLVSGADGETAVGAVPPRLLPPPNT